MDASPNDKPSALEKIAIGYEKGKREAEQDERARSAAIKIQQAWRQRNSRAQLQQKYFSPDLRWKDAVTHARLKVHRSSADAGKNSARDRWNRGAFFALRIRDGNDAMSPTDLTSADDEQRGEKHLEEQHWLELIDSKHRYGSNLKYYHRVWQKADTTDNFFKWLDRGPGKDLSLDECPREQLESERITYLSAEQRLSYLVKVDDAGCLRWSSTNELVDTTAGRWKDSDGSGIIPEDVPDRSVPRRGSFEYIDSPDSSSVESNAAMHYAETTKGSSNWSKLFYRYFTIRGVTDRLLRKTVRRNTWIYCTDKNYNLFIGIKHTGSFQHSSFLAGGIVTSAGLISVKDGLIHTLSPLSGHYRTSIDQFHHFIDILTERGVDMSKVKVSKAEAALWGIEHLTKLKKKQTHLKEVGKEQVSKLGHAAADTLKIGDLHWKREILEGRNWDAKDDKDNTSPKTTDENPRVVVEKGNRGRSDQESNDTL